MIKGEPEIPMLIKVFPSIAVLFNQGLQPFLHRKWIISDTKGIDIYGKQIRIQYASDVFGKAGTHHQYGTPVINAEGIVWQGNFGDQFHLGFLGLVLNGQLIY